MASFTAGFPFAYHAFPLHAWRGIATDAKLLPKEEGTALRPSTSEVDIALGFESFVHTYLVQGPERIPDLPILQAQMQPAHTPPFPHALVELVTRGLDDEECVICNWNLAVSRPAVPGIVRGGNWTRGTQPERIREIWEAFRATNPSVGRARGYFNDAMAVPTLQGRQIRANLGLLGRAPRKIPELLLRGEVPLLRARRVVTFSETDADLLSLVRNPPLPIEVQTFPGYDGRSVSPEARERLTAFLVSGGETDEGPGPFDSIRVVGKGLNRPR